MARTSMAALEATIGIEPRGGNASQAQVYDLINEDMTKRMAVQQWLVLNGIPEREAIRAQVKSAATAYVAPHYLAAWRARVNPKWAEIYNEIGGDDSYVNDAPVDNMTSIVDKIVGDKKVDTSNGVEVAGDTITATTKALAEAADKVITQRLDIGIKDAERRLSKTIDDKIAAASLQFTPAVQQEIKNIAMLSAQNEIERLMPPRRLEIVDNAKGTAVDIGVQHEMFPLLLRAVQARNSDGNRLNILLSGPAGTGKTTAGRMVAKALNIPFGSDSSLDADYKVIGHMDVNGKPVRTEFWRIFTQGGVYVADECDNWLPSAWTALNPALGNGWCTFPDGMGQRHKDCCIIACANTWGLGATADYVGRNRLDAATLDRLQPKIYWGIDEKLEKAIAQAEAGADGIAWCDVVQKARQAAKTQGLKVLITPRATFTGIALMRQGFSRQEITAMTITASLSPEQAKAIGLGTTL